MAKTNPKTNPKMNPKMKLSKHDVLGPDEFNPKTAKERISIWIDEEVIDGFRERAKRENTKYQSLINQALREALDKPSMQKRVERIEKHLGLKAG